MNASSNEEPCMPTDPCIFTAHKSLQGKKVTTLHAFYAACLPCGNTKFPGYFYSLSSKHSRTAFPEEWTPKGRKGQLLVGEVTAHQSSWPGQQNITAVPTQPGCLLRDKSYYWGLLRVNSFNKSPLSRTSFQLQDEAWPWLSCKIGLTKKNATEK